MGSGIGERPVPGRRERAKQATGARCQGVAATVTDLRSRRPLDPLFDVPPWLADTAHVARLVAGRVAADGAALLPGRDGWALVALVAQALDLLADAPPLDPELAAWLAADAWDGVQALTPLLATPLPTSDPAALLRPWSGHAAARGEPPFAELLRRCCVSLCDALATGWDLWSLTLALRDAAHALGAYAVAAAVALDRLAPPAKGAS